MTRKTSPVKAGARQRPVLVGTMNLRPPYGSE